MKLSNTDGWGLVIAFTEFNYVFSAFHNADI